MNTNSIISFLQTKQSFLDTIDTGVIVFDSSKKIVLFNAFADTLLNLSKYDEKVCCYSVFSGNNDTCDDCPLSDLITNQKTKKSYTVVDENGQKILIKVTYHHYDEYTICTIFDVTKEVTLIKKIDLSKKEAEAKNILLERRHEKVRNELDKNLDIIENLPESLVRVNDTFDIQQTNKAVSEMFEIESPEKCYELLSLTEPCELCPAREGYDFAHGFKKRHTVGKRSFTEVILKGEDENSGLLVFTDTTRQINLLEQIKQHQATLSGLVDLARNMQKESDARVVLDYFISSSMASFNANASLLLVNDVRPGSLWLTIDVNIEESAVGDITRSYFSRETQSDALKVVPVEIFPWENTTVIPLIGGHGKRVGLLAYDVQRTEESQEKIGLFADTVGSYIHNQLLMKQLEEKANTDALTNLYNRRYFDSAFEDEQLKFTKYSIPFSIVSIDVNMLKKANDEYGHEVGDALLKKVGELLESSLRVTDIAARTGGDEFIILLTNTGFESAKEFCLRLKNKVFSEVFIELEGYEPFPVTTSIGCASSDSCKIDEIMQVADAMMYKDKEEFYSDREKYR